MKETMLDKYKLVVDEVPADIVIKKTPREFVPVYKLSFPHVAEATQAALDHIREKLVSEMEIKTIEASTPEELNKLRARFLKKSSDYLERDLPHLSDKNKKILSGLLVHKSLGLGPLEIMLQDRNLEEIVINSSKEPVWVYHITLGWLKTNISLPQEIDIYNYASSIGRKVGSQITHLNPLMDAYLTTGDRANATLFPISSKGNTLTIRKFARKAWTITDFISLGAISPEVASFLWLAIQYEMNIIITGGTASGKTSFLNALTGFIPPNHRIISIEDTREIQLPKYLHWVPMTTRPPNPEGKGEITMLQLIINSLRMRPDRIIMGEIRRSREAEVLFEAIHTGHSVYSTFHSNTADETYRRLTNPPINIPVSLLTSMQLIAVMHRDRRRDLRRLLEVTELISGGTDQMKIELNTLYRWVPQKDKIIKMEKSMRALEDIKLFTGMGEKEIAKDLREKTEILKWLVTKKIDYVNSVGKVVSEYYKDPKAVLDIIRSKKIPKGFI